MLFKEAIKKLEDEKKPNALTALLCLHFRKQGEEEDDLFNVPKRLIVEGGKDAIQWSIENGFTSAACFLAADSRIWVGGGDEGGRSEETRISPSYLVAAAERDQAEVITALLKRPEVPRNIYGELSPEVRGKTALIIAAERGYAASVDALLADPRVDAEMACKEERRSSEDGEGKASPSGKTAADLAKTPEIRNKILTRPQGRKNRIQSALGLSPLTVVRSLDGGPA
jgi:hypothetical protein